MGWNWFMDGNVPVRVMKFQNYCKPGKQGFSLYNFHKIKLIMIKSVVTFLNNFTKKTYTSAVALAEGRDSTSLAQRLEQHYQAERKARLKEQAFKVQIAQMGKTEAQLFSLKRNWNNQTTEMTVQEYAETLERLEDKLEEERQARSRDFGHL